MEDEYDYNETLISLNFFCREKMIKEREIMWTVNLLMRTKKKEMN